MVGEVCLSKEIKRTSEGKGSLGEERDTVRQPLAAHSVDKPYSNVGRRGPRSAVTKSSKTAPETGQWQVSCQGYGPTPPRPHSVHTHPLLPLFHLGFMGLRPNAKKPSDSSEPIHAQCVHSLSPALWTGGRAGLAYPSHLSKLWFLLPVIWAPTPLPQTTHIHLTFANAGGTQ